MILMARLPIDTLPTIKHMAQRLPLGFLNDRAPLPRDRLNLVPDGCPDELTKIVRIERV